MLNHFARVEPPVFLADDGSLVGVTSYYDVTGTTSSNLGFVYLLWACWLVVAAVCTASVRHQNR